MLTVKCQHYADCSALYYITYLLKLCYLFNDKACDVIGWHQCKQEQKTSKEHGC